MQRYEVRAQRRPDAPSTIPYRVREEFISHDPSPDCIGLLDRDFRLHYGHSFIDNYKVTGYRKIDSK